MGEPTLSPCSGTIGLLLAFNIIDMLPNATLIPFTWLIAGALLGYAEALEAYRKAGATQIRSTTGGGASSGGPAEPSRPRAIL